MALMMPPGLLRRPPATGLVTPSLNIGTPLTDSTNFSGATSWPNAFTPTSGKVLLMIQGRANGGSTALGTITIGAVNFTQQIFRTGNLSGEAFSGILTAVGVPTGSPLTIAIAGANTIGNVVVLPCDINNWAGSVGVSASNQTDTGTPSSILCTLTGLVGLSSLLVGVGGCVNGSVGPYQDSANGWTHLVSANCGLNDGTDSSAGFFSKTGGAAASNQNFNPTGSIVDDQWSCAALELLAA